MQVKCVLSIDEHVLMSCDQRSSLWLRSQWSCLPEQFPLYTALKSLMCENYIANHKIFQQHQLNFRRFPVFPGAISNSRRFPGVPGVPGVAKVFKANARVQQTNIHADHATCVTIGRILAMHSYSAGQITLTLFSLISASMPMISLVFFTTLMDILTNLSWLRRLNCVVSRRTLILTSISCR